jgi:hypothetical protein
VDLVESLRDFWCRHQNDSNRQRAIQRYCCEQLCQRDLHGVLPERAIVGRYRVKNWDAALVVGGEPRLAISCKSIISNHSGTVPNRIDDMLGEAVSLHRNYPRAVLGHLCMISRCDKSLKKEAADATGQVEPERLAGLHAKADEWFDKYATGVAVAGDRSGCDDLDEKFEVACCYQVDFEVDPYAIVVHPSSLGLEEFFDRLVDVFRQRFGDLAESAPPTTLFR